MGKKISSNNLVENRSESRNISKEDLIPVVKKEVVEWGQDINDEQNYFFNKGAFLSFFFCLSFWGILFFLIT